MLNLKNTIYWKTRNTVSHKVKELQEIHQGPKCNTSHDFNTHGKFTIIEQLSNITLSSTEILKETLKWRENFWKALAPYGLNQELS